MAKRKGKLQPDEAYEFKVHPPGTLSLKDVDLGVTAPKTGYDEELKRRQHQVFGLQVRMFQAGRRAIFAFEGWDAAGKGGCIKRLTAELDPRGYKVWPIGPPDEEARRHHYLWRFWGRLPGKGEVAIFDRSWYGRVLVERVERLARKAEWKRAYDEINAFERMLTSDGVQMAKFFLHIDRKTQLERFKERETDRFKNYKIGRLAESTPVEGLRDRGRRDARPNPSPGCALAPHRRQRQAPRAAGGTAALRRGDGLRARGRALKVGHWMDIPAVALLVCFMRP
jgi:polyphosphate kinase 2 (PPK2 family)